MQILLGFIFFISASVFGEEKVLQILTPSKKGEKTIISVVSYSVQHPLLKGTTLRAHPFPGLRQLIVAGKVSKNLYTSNAGELFEIINFPISQAETKRVLQQIIYGSEDGVTGECLPLSEVTQDELGVYFSSQYKDDPNLESFSKIPGFDRTKACAFLKANKKGMVGSDAIKKHCN